MTKMWNGLRSTIFNIVMFGSAMLISLAGLPFRYLAPSKVIFFGQFWARLNVAALRLICGIPLQVEGLEHLPQGPMILAAQHQSAYDILVWLSLLDRPVYVLKRELLRLPLFGWLLVPAGMIPIDRSGGGGTLRKMVEACRNIIGHGRPIVIFPEGTRVAYGVEVKVQPGIVALARALNVPVVPAATNSGARWGRKAFWKTPGPVRVKIYPPISPNLPREEMLRHLSACYYETGTG